MKKVMKGPKLEAEAVQSWTKVNHIEILSNTFRKQRLNLRKYIRFNFFFF